MGKLLFALIAVASLSFTQGGPTMGNEDDNAPPVITLSPIPPHQKGTMDIKFLPNSVVLLDWHPGGGGTTSVTTDANGKASVTVPANATSVIASDPNGQAQPVSEIVVP